MKNTTTIKTVRIDGNATVKFELPALRGKDQLRAAERRASLIHDYVMSWNTSSMHKVDMMRSDLQVALDVRDSAAFWLKATPETVKSLCVEGQSLHI